MGNGRPIGRGAASQAKCNCTPCSGFEKPVTMELALTV